MSVLSGLLGLFLVLAGFALSIAILLAQLRLFSIDKTLKQIRGILAELQRAVQPPGAEAPESEAERAKRRAAIAEVQNSWLIK